MLKDKRTHYLTSFDGTKIYVATNRDSKNLSKETPLLFNYGLVCNNAHWEKQIAFFDEAGYPIIIHDYRGHFNSSPNLDAEKVTFENIVGDMEMIANYFNLASLHLFGHSMGVNVSLEFTRKFPELVKSQILIAGTAFPPQDVMFDSQGMNIIFPLIKKLQSSIPTIYDFLWKTGGLNPLVQYLVHTGGFNVNETSKEFVQVYVNRIGKLNPKIFIKLLEEMRDHSILNKLESMNTPSLVIAGDKDKVIPFPIQNILHERLGNSELYIVKDGSHVPQVDFPNFINERITLFLKS